MVLGAECWVELVASLGLDLWSRRHQGRTVSVNGLPRSASVAGVEPGSPRLFLRSGVGWGTSRFSSRGESRFLGSFSANLLPGGAVLILIKLNCTGSFFFLPKGAVTTSVQMKIMG